MNKVVIVLLNYLNYKDTIECIESIKNESYENKEIVVVENGSNNESWDVLVKRYSDENGIYLVRSEKNLGFAKGNNLGIRYARNELNAEFILLANNDTIFTDKMLIKKLMEAYKEDIAVIGPRIIERNGMDQNPIQTMVSKEAIEADFKYLSSNKYRLKNNAIYQKLKKNEVLVKIKRYIFNRYKNDNKKVSGEKESVDLVLHGACMLLTKSYFEFYPYLFPDTFLYYEENILTLITRKVNLKKKFINNASIYHKEDQSSAMSFNNNNDIRLKFLLQSINKCKEIYDLEHQELTKCYFSDEV